ncbi:unnamed protein product [Aphanomyces euteiches]
MAQVGGEWYLDEAKLLGAVSRAIQGYKGKVAERWHVIPIAFKTFSTTQANLLSVTENPQVNLVTCDERSGGFVALLDDTALNSRLARLRDVSNDVNFDYFSIMGGFTQLAFDVEDSTGTRFQFEMLYNEGSVDANTGFFAVVYNRKTGTEVAHCVVGGDIETAIKWVDHTLLERFKPHEGLCPPTQNGHLSRHEVINGDKALHHEFFDSSLAYDGLHVTSGDSEKNQLELLLAVAAKLCNQEEAIFFPKIVPNEVLAKAKTVYLNQTLSPLLASDACGPTGQFLDDMLFLDHDVQFRDQEDWDD